MHEKDELYMYIQNINLVIYTNKNIQTNKPTNDNNKIFCCTKKKRNPYRSTRDNNKVIEIQNEKKADE